MQGNVSAQVAELHSFSQFPPNGLLELFHHHLDNFL